MIHRKNFILDKSCVLPKIPILGRKACNLKGGISGRVKNQQKRSNLQLVQ